MKRHAPATSAEFFGPRVRRRVGLPTASGEGGAAPQPPTVSAAREVGPPGGARALVCREKVLAALGPPRSDDETGGAGEGEVSYFESRARKLREQNGGAAAGVFAGLTMYINGRTGDVSACVRGGVRGRAPARFGERGHVRRAHRHHLTRLIHEHGGSTGMMFRKTRVTHVVAVNLSGSKCARPLSLSPVGAA